MRGSGCRSSPLTVLFCNIRSVLNKRDCLVSTIDTCTADIVALTETWLHSNIRDAEIFPFIDRFTIYRCDRINRPGGGVLLAVPKAFPSQRIEITSHLEMLWALVEINHQKVVIGLCYRPPSYTSTFVNELHDAINSVLSRYPTLPLFLLGDFNIPSIAWYSEPPLAYNKLAQDFLDLCSTFSLTQLVRQPTRITSTVSNILDLLLTSVPDFVSNVTCLPGLSDHSLITFQMNFSRPKSSKKYKFIRNYRNANFEAINRELSTFIDTFFNHFDNRSVQSNWSMFIAKVAELTNKYIPLHRIISNRNAPWFNITLKRLANKKKRLYRLARLRPSGMRWELYKQASEEYAVSLKKSKINYQQNTLPSMLTTDPRKFWRSVNPKADDTVNLIDSTGGAISPEKCASVFNTIFSRNFSDDQNIPLPEFSCSEYTTMFPIIIHSTGVENVINKLKCSSSPGCDEITTKFLKATMVYSSIILTRLFQQSLDTGSLPVEWKIGKVIPLFKSGNQQSPLNYRPISLTSIPCKIFEHILFSNLANFLESNSFFSPSQHGFRKSYSCETQLISFTHKLHAILDRSSLIDCIFLDFSKAFDKVCHKLLLYKLRQLNIDTKLLFWLEIFLTNRSQFVSTNNVNSEHTAVRSGVPQGTVLGPLLFLIYINDLPSCVSSYINLFADDCVVYREITCVDDTKALQSDLDAINKWCNIWLMELNIRKCKHMRISRTSSVSSIYHIASTSLETVSSYKYLGIHITSNLSWADHISYVISNANRILGYLRRNFAQVSSSIKLTMYKTLIRPKLEYAASVWDPSHENLIRSLEMVQNNSTRFILSNYNRTASISAMKLSLDLSTLASRRKLFRLSLFHSIFHHPQLHHELISPPQYVSSRLDHAQKVRIPFCRTDAFFQSFLPRTSEEWNHLPSDVISIRNHHLFKNALANIV